MKQLWDHMLGQVKGLYVKPYVKQVEDHMFSRFEDHMFSWCWDRMLSRCGDRMLSRRGTIC